MAKVIFILGGARSGKSSYAIELAKRGKNKVAFIATSQGLDKEMARRIQLHKKARPKNWQTFEEPCNVSGLLNKIKGKFDVILIDCFTILISNLMLKGLKENGITKEVDDILLVLNKSRTQGIIISNEVGLGIVPRNKLARNFRDIAGKINQIVASKSNEVFFMVSGIPLKIKGKKNE